MSVIDRMVTAALPAVPGFAIRSVGRRYVAGESLDDAVGRVRSLMLEGASATVDVLGEQVRDRARAAEAVEEYLRLVEAIRDGRLASTVSIKPTLMGLRIGESEALGNMDRVLSRAARAGVTVQIDMEDSTTTDATLRLYRELHSRHGNAAAVLQASLRRTARDVDAMPEGAVVRLCKGIYVESEEIQAKDPGEVGRSYLDLLARLLDRGAFVGIATHDEGLVEGALSIVGSRRLGPDRYEFQTLLGVRPRLAGRLIAGGHGVRVYVPYGRDWEAYSLRRLRENPAIARHVIAALAGLG